MADPLIDIADLHAYYGEAHVLQGVSLRIAPGEAVGLLGRNGMGKTTLIRAMLRLMRATTGRITIRGRDCTGERPDRVARMGIGYVPEGRGIFPNLSVRENLLMAARPGLRGQTDWSLERVLETFPRLTERLHHGGNQLAGRVLRSRPSDRAPWTIRGPTVLGEAPQGRAARRGSGGWSSVSGIPARAIASMAVDRDSRSGLARTDRCVVLER